MLLDPELYRRDVLLRSGVRLSALDVRPEQPAERTLLLLHGFGGSAAQWELILRAFSSRSRVIALDLRGHGRSEKPRSQYTMAEMLHDVEEAAEALGLPDAFVLWGHSFGAAVATEYALAHPGRVAKLVLSSATGDYHLGARISFLFHLPAWLLDGLRATIRKVANKRFNAPAHVLKPLYRRTLMTWRGWERYAQLRVPTMVIHGSRDYLFSQSDLHRVAQEIGGSEHVAVPQSYHMVILDRSDAVVRSVERFLGTEQGWRRGGKDNGHRSTRPWVAHYEEGVPPSVAVPDQPLDQLLRIAAQRSPHRTALWYLGRRISYRELDRLADRFATGLQEMGVNPPERVMLVLPNSPQAVFCYYGALRAGCVVVLGNPLSPAAELARQAQDSGARVVVAASRLKEQVAALREGGGQEFLLETRLADWGGPLAKLKLREPAAERDLRAMLREGKPRRPIIDPRGLAVLAYTGGTTDDPKGVMLSHRNLMANAIQLRHWLPQAREGRERILGVLPFSHSYGMTACMNLGMALGGTIVLVPRFDVDDVLAAVQRHKPTMLPGVPPMYNAIKDHPRATKRRLRSIRFCVSGAAPLPVEVQEGFERVTRARLVEGYGLTEAGPVTHANPLGGRRRTGSIGLPLPGTDAKVVDLVTGQLCAPGDIGELLVKGPQVMLGYWRRAKETEEAIGDGWLRTGDLAAMDPEGWFHIVDRKKDIVLTEHGIIYPRDVEEVLYEHPKVFEAAVVGQRVREGVAQVHAFVVLKRGEQCTSEEIREFCARRLQGPLVPRSVEFRGELPKSFVGKVLRRMLAEPGARR